MKPYSLILVLGLFLLSCNTQEQVDKQLSYTSEIIDQAIPFANGVISTETNSEFSIAFTPDGKTAYFSRRAKGEKQKIYETKFMEGNWSAPQLAKFSTDRDETPSISADGKLFFFGSEREIPGKPNKGNFDMNIWRMENTKDGWGTAQALDAPINEVQIEGEEWPSSNNNFLFTLDNENFYFTTMKRGDKAIKLYQTKFIDNKFTDPIPITGLFEDEKYWIYSAVISPDNQYLVFNSYGAPGGVGGEDIFISKRMGDGWSKAKPIGDKVNSKNEESSPRFSRDGKYFFFSRAENRGNDEYGEWSIFYIETAFLELEKLFEEN